MSTLPTLCITGKPDCNRTYYFGEALAISYAFLITDPFYRTNTTVVNVSWLSRTYSQNHIFVMINGFGTWSIWQLLIRRRVKGSEMLKEPNPLMSTKNCDFGFIIYKHVFKIVINSFILIKIKLLITFKLP